MPNVELAQDQVINLPDVENMSPEEARQMLRQLQSSTNPLQLDPRFGELVKPVTPTGIETFIKEQGLPMLLPSTGAIIGLLGGSAVGGPTGGLVGEALGSAGGEALNQVFGITPRSNLNIGIAGALPPLFRGAGTLFKAGLKHFIRRSPALHEFGISILEKLGNRFSTPDDVIENAYKELDAIQNPVTLDTTKQTVDSLMKELKIPSLQEKEVLRDLKKLSKRMEKPYSFEEIRLELQALGKRVGTFRRSGQKENAGVYKKIISTIYDELEKIANKQDISLLKDVVRRSQRNFVADELDQFIMQKTIELPKQGERFAKLNIAPLQKEIELIKKGSKKVTLKSLQNALKRGTVTKAEFRDIEATVQMLQRIPKLKEEPFIKGFLWRQGLPFMLMSSSLKTLNPEINAWFWGLVGSMGLEAFERIMMTKAMTNMLLSPIGRKLLRQSLTKSGLIDANTMAIMAQFALPWITSLAKANARENNLIPSIPVGMGRNMPSTVPPVSTAQGLNISQPSPFTRIMP